MNNKLLSLFTALPLFAFSTETTEKKPEFPQYNNRVVLFMPYHQSYERIKNDSIYAGVQAFVVACNADRLLLNAELRMGYNFFFNQRDHVTPFAAAGYVRGEHASGVAYGALGVLYTHEFTSVFNLGLNAKAILGGQAQHSHFEWGSPVGGGQVSVPFTFRFGGNRHWDVRLEPFDLFLAGSKHFKNFAGCITTLGYRF
jgi:hypothetical protein